MQLSTSLGVLLSLRSRRLRLLAVEALLVMALVAPTGGCAFVGMTAAGFIGTVAGNIVSDKVKELDDQKSKVNNAESCPPSGDSKEAPK